MTSEVLHQRGTTLVRRLRLEPGEEMPWHRDPYPRVTVVLSGDALAIELESGGKQRIAVAPGQVDWDEPDLRRHRGVNVGTQAYEEIAVFLLDQAGVTPQPG